jgi:hypothetical protein
MDNLNYDLVLCQPDFACEADALKALAHFENTLKITSILDRQVNALAHYSKPSRPPRDQKPERYHYRIQRALAPKLSERTRRLERKSDFILATNQLDDQALFKCPPRPSLSKGGILNLMAVTQSVGTRKN